MASPEPPVGHTRPLDVIGHQVREPVYLTTIQADDRGLQGIEIGRLHAAIIVLPSRPVNRRETLARS